MQKILDTLNDKQKEAVLNLQGPMMIIAGAGSGKTKVLTTRIAHLIQQGVSPFNILALTFTNKAAKEMKERIEQMLTNTKVRNLYIGTFHSVFARLLRSDATHLGYPKDFSIYDVDDSKSVIKSILKLKNLDDKIYKPNIVYDMISSAKNALVTPEDYIQNAALRERDILAKRPLMGEIYMDYCLQCFKNGAMDFDDLLFQTHKLIRHVPAILVQYQQKFHYVLIDEFQDTNPLQYQIVKKIAAANENICVVGDDAQSIYSFRGATIDNILKFETDYPDVKIIKLEQNYRSSRTILDTANHIISHNKMQFEKKLWTDNESGNSIRLVSTFSDNEESKFVADTIKELNLRYHQPNTEIVILYRTNAQSRSFEESLRRENIPYKIYGGMSFYQRKEIKDFIAYLKCVCNSKDEESLKRIINYPARGIGNTSIEKLGLIANEKNISFWEVLKLVAQGYIKLSASKAIEEFVTMMEYFRSMLLKLNAYDLALLIGKNSQINKELYQDKSVEGLARHENLQELLNSIQEFTNMPNEDGELVERHLGEYLQQIVLLTDADQDDSNQDTVKLMTIHSAKGLEFANVFVVGLEENIFPSWMSLKSSEGEEEERRLFYVAVTRAKQNLWLSYANSRYQYGNAVSNEPSRFIDEIPQQFLDTSKAKNSFQNKRVSIFREVQKKPFREVASDNRSNVLKPIVQKYVHIPSEGFKANDPEELEVGARIEHEKFGFGKITSIEGSAHNRMAIIDFDRNGQKRILLNYAKLRIVLA